MQIQRIREIASLNKRFRNNPVVSILGARQCGKTTLARQFSEQWPTDVTFFDLENPLDIRRLEEPLLALENVEGLIAIKALQLKEDETFFWGVHASAEIDLVFQKNGRLYGVEVKYAQAPGLTPSMRMACDELDLKHLWVIYPGKTTYALDRNITGIPVTELGGLKFQ